MMFFAIRIELANVAAVHRSRKGRAYDACRIHIEKINGPFLFTHGGSPAEYGAGISVAISRGWLWRHESGTYVKFTQAGAEMFA
jgi:hypothetical protein